VKAKKAMGIAVPAVYFKLPPELSGSWMRDMNEGGRGLGSMDTPERELTCDCAVL